MPDLYISPSGDLTAIYTDAIDFAALGDFLGGEVSVRRASHVEPAGLAWSADMGPVDGPVLGPFPSRAEALAREVEFLRGRLEVSPAALFLGCGSPVVSYSRRAADAR